MINNEASGLSHDKNAQPTPAGDRGLLDRITGLIFNRSPSYEPTHFVPSQQLIDVVTPQDLADIDDFLAAHQHIKQQVHGPQ